MTIKKQNDINECGLVIIQSLHKEFHSNNIDINELKRHANMSEKGMTVANLIILGKEYGITIEAYKGNAKDLLSNDLKEYQGCMINDNGANHYVLFKRVANKILVLDPIKGRYLMSQEKFEKIFANILFVFEKGVYSGAKTEYVKPFSLLLKQPTLIFSILSLIIISIATTFVSTFLMKIILDTIIPGVLRGQLTVIIFVFIWVALLNIFSSVLKTFFSKKLTLIIETNLTDLYFKKIRKASIIDLQKVNISDHLRRISMIESSASFVSNVFMVSFGESVKLMISSTIMIWINMKMFAIAAAGGFTIVISTLIFNLFIKDKYSSVLEKQLDFLTLSIDSVMSFKELKEPVVAEANRLSHEKKYYGYKTSEYSLWKMDTAMNVLNNLLNMIMPILLIYISTTLVFDNKITVGSMVMFISLFHSFISPLESIAHMFTKLPLAKKNLKMISYVLSLEIKEHPKNKMKLKRIEEISLKNISFGYDRKLFDIKEYQFDRNIHLSGKNGSGKSSLMNIISGRYKFDGEMKVNSIDINTYSEDMFRERIFSASPTSYMQSGSIYEYITLGNKEAMEIFNSNMVAYNLHSLFDEIGLSFEQQIIQNGDSLSSGQRQLVILMRLFAFGYDVILLDEAMENIDSEKVKWLSGAINEVQTSIFIEISHSEKYLSKGRKVGIDEIIKN